MREREREKAGNDLAQKGVILWNIHERVRIELDGDGGCVGARGRGVGGERAGALGSGNAG